MSWIADIFAPKQRAWEDFYRNRWQYDKIVRSTHGVNCTGSCSWNIYVKNGIVTWEMQALDYPELSKDLPPYEPRGCQRGISYSWYIYSPLRVKYPYLRGALMDLWREAKTKFPDDSVAAWASIVESEESRKRYHSARGKGGFRRASWEEVREIMAASNIYTIKKHGPDRIVGFSPIPAMSMVSYAAGSRFMQLMGGVSMSFYDWYCDLPPASPEIWGEQTDVGESADWFHSKMIAVVGSNVLMTRTPDAHFLVEARHGGSKVVVFSPDFSMTSKVADDWLPIHQGQDGAFWLAVSHVILRENYLERTVPFFENYLKQFSDASFLVKLTATDDGCYTAGKYLHAKDLDQYATEENGEWKMLIHDRISNELRMPLGTIGHRWQTKKGEWNLKLEDAITGEVIDPAIQLPTDKTEPVTILLNDFCEGKGDVLNRHRVRAMKIATSKGDVFVTTVFELQLASYGLRQESGQLPDYHEDQLYTPVWQEKFTGISSEQVIRFARDWARTAEATEGKCSIIIGAGVNHWYHNNLIYRAAINALIFCGCVGKNGGGLNHYVGQEKLVPQESWGPIAFATDWGGPPRLQNSPSFHYVHSDQWRYEKEFNELCPVSDKQNALSSGHTIDKQIHAVRHGWLPCYPQFDRNSLELAKEAAANGAKTDEEIVAYVADQIRNRKLKFSMEDPDNPSCFPRVWYIWRGNALMSSAKGHEYFLKHYLGTHNNSIADEVAKDSVHDVVWHEAVTEGKFDLIVDVNYRMDSSALYSDIVLPTATYYEKNDLNSTDMHAFIHPLQAAVPPCWESKSDWNIFRDLAEDTSKLAKKHFNGPVRDVIAFPLLHDTPAELAQPTMLDWTKGECAAIPGKTMPNLKVIERDYTKIFEKFISLGPGFRNNGLGIHGTVFQVDDLYDKYLEYNPTEEWGGKKYPSLKEDRSVCEAILHFSSVTNGELAYRAYAAEAIKTGIDHTHEAEATRDVRANFDSIIAQPFRTLTTPYWTGNTRKGRTYSAYCQNIEGLIPFRTLSGRQHLYFDHDAYIAFGEHLPTYKPRPDRVVIGDLVKSSVSSGSIVLNYLTPHGKWSIHSTYSDTLRMRTLSRGVDPLWINVEDAALIGIEDNDWVEVFNDHGVVCTRANVSARIPRGICLLYHAPERTLSVPKSKERKNRRAGGHNSLTKVRLKPLFMSGGYGQFTYAFNYWGPQGINRDTFVVVKKLTKVDW
ncbi:MAG: nitrate reductase subunit alpha [bacterium]|nr:nitrate reductase subunit alpha [bacterium]